MKFQKEKPSCNFIQGFISSFSFCPQKYKSNALFILFERAYKINQNFSNIHEAVVSLSSKLKSNRNNDSEIKNAIHKVYTQYNQDTPPVTDEEPPDKFYLQLLLQTATKKQTTLIKNCLLLTLHLFTHATKQNIYLKVYFGATDRHFSTRQSEHMKGKNKSEIAQHTHAPKKTNFEVLGKFNYPFIAETLYICMSDI